MITLVNNGYSHCSEKMEIKSSEHYIEGYTLRVDNKMQRNVT